MTALIDVKHIERDSIGWDVDGVENAAQEAAQALDDLSSTLATALTALPAREDLSHD